jgi:hypothetical protein
MATASVGGDAGWPARAASLAMALGLFLVAFLSAVAVAGLGVGLAERLGLVAGDGTGAQLVGMVLSFVGFGVGVAGFLGVTGRLEVIDLRWPTRRDAAWAAGGLVAILVLALVIEQLLAAARVDVAQNNVLRILEENPAVAPYLVAISLVFVGPFEELVFRGGVQGLLRGAWGSRNAVLVASALFGAAHLPALIGTGTLALVAYLAVAAVLGLVLGGIYERTRNLLVPAVVHGVYNSVLFVVAYVQITGGLG